MIYTLNPGSDTFEKSLALNFQEVDERFHQTDIRFEKTDNKIDLLRKDMDAGFDKVNARIDLLRKDMDAGFDKVNARFEKVDVRFMSLEMSMNKQFRVLTWSMGIGFTMLTAMLSVLSVLVLKAIA